MILFLQTRQKAANSIWTETNNFMWKLIKFIMGVVVVVFAISYLFHIPISDFTKLLPKDVVSKFSTFKEETLSPTIQNIQKQVLAPTPLRVSNTDTAGVLTKSGVITLTNTERKKTGLGALSENPLLDKSAEMKLHDLFDKQYFAHESPTGAGPSDLADKAGYSYIMIGENLALGNFSDDAALLKAWMESSGHRANILNDKYAEIGVAVGKGTFEKNEVWIGVQEFGLPSSACPEPSLTLKAEIDSGRQMIDTLFDQITAKKAQMEAADKNTSDYNNRVNEYNVLVDTYNAQIATTKSKIATYNAQVNASNSCRAHS